MVFEEIQAAGADWFELAIEAEVQETLTLDFKVARVGQQGAQFTPGGALTREGRTTLSSALSAFANSAGGQIILGVDCRKNGDGVDCLAALDPIPNLAAALTSVNSAIGDLMHPKHEGVRAIAIPSASDKTVGFLVIDVPRSERRPHMCQMTKQYFKRAGTSSFAMEHYDVEDAFRRLTTPDIKLYHMYVAGTPARGGPVARLTVKLPLMIENVGLVSAKYISVTLDPQREGVHLVLDAANRTRGNRYSTFAGRVVIAPPLDFVVHPGEVREIDELQFTMTSDAEGRIRMGDAELAHAFAFQPIRLSAENMRPREYPISLDAAEFNRLVAEYRFH